MKKKVTVPMSFSNVDEKSFKAIVVMAIGLGAAVVLGLPHFLSAGSSKSELQRWVSSLSQVKGVVEKLAPEPKYTPIPFVPLPQSPFHSFITPAPVVEKVQSATVNLNAPPLQRYPLTELKLQGFILSPTGRQLAVLVTPTDAVYTAGVGSVIGLHNDAIIALHIPKDMHKGSIDVRKPFEKVNGVTKYTVVNIKAE